MELRHLRYFCAVVEELHFRRAAERLHMAQPPLSQQIQKLEDEIGVRLLLRSKRRVELTAAGRAFLGRARQILAEAEGAILAAQRADRGEVGPLAIALGPIAAVTVLGRILPRHRELFPEVRLTIEESLMSEAVQALERGAADVALTLPYFFSELLQRETLLSVPLVAALSRSSPLSRRDSIFLRELGMERFLLFPNRPGSGFYEHILGLCQRAGFTPKATERIDRLPTLLALVAAGYGVAIVPAGLPEGTATREIAFVKVEKPSAVVEICAAWRANDTSPLVHAFVETARAACRSGARGEVRNKGRQLMPDLPAHF
jgi:DNA-binding transcriptional LysR family regulator